MRRIRFGGLRISHDESVLTPRPWTLLQSTWAVELSGTLGPGPILELCCGAGHIGLEAARRTARDLIQVDRSSDACAFARLNAGAAGLDSLVTVHEAPLEQVPDFAPGPFPLVLADPPYLPTDEVAAYPEDPILAIDGGTDGLDALRACLTVIDRVLDARGVALVQVRGVRQAEQLLAELPAGLRAGEIRRHDDDRAVVSVHRPDPPAAHDPTDEERERADLVALLDIHDLWLAPVHSLGGREWLQLDADTVAEKQRLEAAVLDRLGGSREDGFDWSGDPRDAADAMRRIAAIDMVPDVYGWLAEEASWEQIVTFLAYEGGPDAGFDDLVAIAQVGIHDGPKVTLGANYWDEMGRGELARVHTVLHDDLVAASGMPRIARQDQPVDGLRRTALGNLLATNRALQPELLGALGLIEMQAGPRCRAVVRALRRVDAPEGTFPFYEEHAVADPRHGKEWLDGVVDPLADQHPGWGARMVEGAWWRHRVNEAFFGSIRAVVEGHAPG